MRFYEQRYKERLKGFTQVEGIEYIDTFSPVVKHFSIKVFMEIMNKYIHEFEKMEVNTTFLHEYPKKTIYIEHIKGFIEEK